MFEYGGHKNEQENQRFKNRGVKRFLLWGETVPYTQIILMFTNFLETKQFFLYFVEESFCIVSS